MTSASRSAGTGLSLILATTYAATAIAQQPVSIESHDVQFVSDGATLRGTVFLPQKSPLLAAVVWVDGAGKTERKPALANYLGQFGLAVLTYDKRGVGKSGGVYAGQEAGTVNVSRENLNLLADDAAAAMRLLQDEKPLRKTPLGFIGGSQAGWIVPLAALESPEARFMVLWSGAVETTHEDVLFERIALPDPDFWSHHTHDEVRAMMAVAPDRIAWPDFDPRTPLSKLKIPGLWVFGGQDRNMYVDMSVDRLDGLIKNGHPNYEYRLFPNYDHELGHEELDVMQPTVEWIRNSLAGASR